MRLTVDAIQRAQISINPLKQRELNLRGLKAPAIENLGVTKDGFDCIDLSDNEIKKLENFPRLRRLRTLLLNNNHVSKFHESLADSIENLEYLVLTGNRISQLSEIDHLASLKKLDTLSLVGNPVTKRKYYREYVIHKLPQLRVLDFQKVKPRERDAAAVFFSSVAGKRVIQDAAGSENNVEESSAPPPPPPRSALPVPPPPPPAKSVAPSSHVTSGSTVTKPAPAASTSSPVRGSSMNRETAEDNVTMDTPISPVKPATPEDFATSNITTPSKTHAAADVEMSEVPFTPSKPIDSLTVTQLRDALKDRGLSTKGLKAELVKRLKEAVGST